MIKNILFRLALLLCIVVPISASAQCSLDDMGGSAGDRVYTCSPDNATYSITFPELPVDGFIQYASLGTISGNTISGIPSGAAVQVTLAKAGCATTQTRWMRNCCGPSTCPPDRIWEAIGTPPTNGASSYYDMMFRNSLNGEIRHAFCTEVDMGGPNTGALYCLDDDGLTLHPVSRCSQQIMYIFGSKCDYEKPVLGGIPASCATNDNLLTASCTQGIPMWYKKDSLGLTFLGSGNSAPSGFSSLRNYLRCENVDKSCFSEYVTINIRSGAQANPQPSPEKTEICIGETVNLSFEEGCNSNAGYFDKWYVGSTPLASPVVSPAANTTYTLRCINARGCDVTTAPVDITITIDESCSSPCNAPTIKTGLPVRICAGESVTLTAPDCGSGFTHLWSNGVNTRSIVVAPTALTVYTVKCVSNTIPNCESNSSSHLVMVNAIPIIAAGTPVCSSDGQTYSVPFTLLSGETITNTTSGTIDGNFVINIPAGTSATVTVRNAEGCETTAIFTQTCQIPCTAPNPTVSEDISICPGTSTSLNAEGCSTGFTYRWSNGGTTQSITVSPTSSTTYTVICESSTDTDCKSDTPASVLVNFLNAPVLTIGSPVCTADSPFYSVSFTVTPGATVTTTAGIINGNTINNIPSTISATLTATMAGCSIQSSTSPITCTCIGQKPNDYSDITLCYGDTINLPFDPGYGSFALKWFDTSGQEVLPGDVLIATENTSFLHRFASVVEGCLDGDNGLMRVFVNPLPEVTAGAPVCSSDAQTYSVTFAIPAGATISSTAGTVSANTVSGIPSGTTATVTVTSTEGCENTTTVMQNCAIPCNAPNPTVSEDISICSGTNTILNAEGCSTGYTYRWSNGVTTQSITVSPTSATTYSVVCVSSTDTDCQSETPAEVLVTLLETPVLTLGTPVCGSNSPLYSVSFTATSGAVITASAGTISGNSIIDIQSGVTVTVRATAGTCWIEESTSASCFCIGPKGHSGNYSICLGESIDLSQLGGCNPMWSSRWRSAGGILSSTLVSPTENVNYYHSCVRAGCEDGDEGLVSVVVNPLPTITYDTPVCSADGLTYSVTFTIPAGATLASTAGIVSANTVSGIPSGTTATVTVTSTEGCENTTTVTQNCTIPCNAPNIKDGLPARICEGGTTILTASTCDDGFTYLWSTGETTKSIIVSPAITSEYSVRCVSATISGCEGKDAKYLVTVNLIPTITYDTPVCSADGLTYSVTFTIPSGASLASTAGIVSGNTVSGIPSGTIATITVTSAEGCENTITVIHTCSVFDLALRKVLKDLPKGATVTPGSDVTFTIDVINQGNVDATNVLITDYIPAGLTLNDNQWIQAAGNATRTLPALAAGQTLSLDISFTVNTGFTGTIRNLAEISDAENAEGLEDIDSRPDNNPDNDGTAKDDIVDEDHKNNPDDDEDDHDFEEITVTPEPVFDLALRKVLKDLPKGATVTPGSDVTFTIDVINQGNVDATNVLITDYIPAGLTLNDNQWIQAAGNATRTLPALAAGQTLSLDISFTVNTGFTGTIRNLAEISDAENAEGLEDIDSTPDNNPDNDGTAKDDIVDEDHKNNPDDDEDDHDFEEITVTPKPVFDLALRKTMSVGSKTVYKVGDTVTFDITVFNQGTVDATSADLVDYIPAGLTLQDTNWTLDGDKARWAAAVTNLSPGAQQTVSITFLINSSANGVIINTAEISGATNPEGLEDIDSTPDDDKDNDGAIKNDEISENGKTGGDEDDHDIEPINICPDAKCLNATATKRK